MIEPAYPRRPVALRHPEAAPHALDAFTALTGSLAIVLATIWCLCLTMVEIIQNAATQGVAIGAPVEIEFARVGSLICLPLAGLAAFLAVRAHALPRAIPRAAVPVARTPGAVR
jgi:hypothetical protein